MHLLHRVTKHIKKKLIKSDDTDIFKIATPQNDTNSHSLPMDPNRLPTSTFLFDLTISLSIPHAGQTLKSRLPCSGTSLFKGILFYDGVILVGHAQAAHNMHNISYDS